MFYQAIGTLEFFAKVTGYIALELNPNIHNMKYFRDELTGGL